MRKISIFIYVMKKCKHPNDSDTFISPHLSIKTLIERQCNITVI